MLKTDPLSHSQRNKRKGDKVSTNHQARSVGKSGFGLAGAKGNKFPIHFIAEKYTLFDGRIVVQVCYDVNVPSCSTNQCGMGGCPLGQSVCSLNQYNTQTVCPLNNQGPGLGPAGLARPLTANTGVSKRRKNINSNATCAFGFMRSLYLVFGSRYARYCDSNMRPSMHWIGWQRCRIKQYCRRGLLLHLLLEASHHEQPLSADPQPRVQRRTDGRTVQRGLPAVLRAEDAEGVSPGPGEDDPQDQAADSGEADVEEGVQDSTVQPDRRLLQDRLSNHRRIQGG